MTVTVGLDAVRQAGQISIRKEFAPALKIERGLSLGGMELDRQRHSRELYSIDTDTASLGALGVAVETNGTRPTIRARKAVIIATGGSSGNVNFRRMFDPRLTQEYCGIGGMPWSDQDASGDTQGISQAITRFWHS